MLDSYIIPTLIVCFVFNGFLASIIIARGLRSVVNILYGLFSVSVAAWILMLWGYFSGFSFQFNWLAGTHISALTIAMAFFLFSGVFPRTIFKSWIPYVVTIASYGFISYILLTSGYIVGHSQGIAYELGPAYLFYAAVLLLFFGLGYFNLYRQYSTDNSLDEKLQIGFVLGGTFFASMSAMITDLIFPYFEIFSLTWLGPVFTIVMVTSTFVAIVKYRLFNIKIIATEAFVFLLWAFELIRTAAARTIPDQILNGSVFIATIIIGTFLIRSFLKELRHLERIEDMANRLKSVNRILSHDVKSTLGKSRDLCSMMLDGSFGPMPDKLKTYLQDEFVSTGKLISSITTILEAGSEIKLTIAPFDLKDAVLEVVNDVRSDAERKGLTIETDIAEGQNYTVTADRVQLTTHVLRNLIENATNYTPKGSIRVTLANDGAGVIRLAVQDTGVGISEEDKAKLFTEGGRGDDSLKVNVHSTGYGLFIAKKVVDAHGGKIWAESAGPNKGSIFTVELPVSR